jgi:hypothetical protein
MAFRRIIAYPSQPCLLILGTHSMSPSSALFRARTSPRLRHLVIPLSSTCPVPDLGTHRTILIDSPPQPLYTRAGVLLIDGPPQGKGVSMNAYRVLAAVSMLLVLTLGALGFAGESSRPPASPAPSIEGTYRLISRQTPDGMMLRPPEVMGLFTYTKSHRNFNIISKDAEGKWNFLALVSTYELTPTEYRETLIYSTRVRGQEISHDLSGETRRVPVTVEDGRIQFKLPFEPPSVVVEGNKITATADGRVDV